MRGSRDKLAINEQLPDVEIVQLKKRGRFYQVRTNFRGKTIEDQEGLTREIFEFETVRADTEVENWDPNGRHYRRGEKFVYAGTTYVVIQGHYTQVAFPPNITPTLCVVSVSEQGVEEYVPVQNGSQAGRYMKDSQCIFNGVLYTSLIDYNVWPPTENTWVAGTPGEEPGGDLCETTEEWSGNKYDFYRAQFEAGVPVYVKYSNAIWKAKSTSHLWIAPAAEGNGAISWDWIQNCV